MAIKNQSLIVHFVAWDSAAAAARSGDAANFTLRVIKDGVAAAPTNAPAEVDATNAPGVYKLTLTAAEMNADAITVAGKSSTANVSIIPMHVTTERGLIDAAVSTRAAAADYTGARAAKIDLLDAAISTRSSHTATDVWAATTRTLTSFGFSVIVGTNNDKTGYALTVAAEDAIVDKVWDEGRSNHVAAGSFGQGVSSVQGNVTGSVNSVATDVSITQAGADKVWQSATRTLTSLGAALVQEIWDRATTALVVAGSVGKRLVDNLDAAITTRASQASLDVVDDYVDTEVAAIKAKTDQFAFTNAGKVDASILSAADFAQAAADKVWASAARTLTSLGASLVQEIWDRATSALVTAGSIGKRLADNIDAAISTRSSHSAADVWAVATRTLTAFGFTVSTTANSTESAIKAKTDHLPAAPVHVSSSVSDTTPAAGNFDAAAGLSATDNFYNGALLVFTSGALLSLARKVTGYTGTTRNLQFANAFPIAPADSDTFLILGRID